jgi:hypothetical protein
MQRGKSWHTSVKKTPKAREIPVRWNRRISSGGMNVFSMVAYNYARLENLENRVVTVDRAT